MEKHQNKMVQIFFQNEEGSWDHMWDERRQGRQSESWEQSKKTNPQWVGPDRCCVQQSKHDGMEMSQEEAAVIKENREGENLKEQQNSDIKEYR